MTIDTRQIERVRDRIAQYMADETSCLMEQYINAEDLKLVSKVLAAYAATSHAALSPPVKDKP
jgi:hypothetical protein